jgi:hypothetical protein
MMTLVIPAGTVRPPASGGYAAFSRGSLIRCAFSQDAP